MAPKKVKRIPTNLIVGFLGSGKTTAIAKLIAGRPERENWSILINEFGKVSIDHALVDSDLESVNIEELAGGCACCTMSFVFKPLLAQFLRRTKPDRLILEPSGLSHPAKIIDILRSKGFARSIDLRNVICLVDPKDFDDSKWKDSQVFHDQVQLADVVALNWTDKRDPEQIQRCRQWIESFDPPKQLIFETSFGAIDPELLDRDFGTVRIPLFADAHSTTAQVTASDFPVLRSSQENSPLSSNASEPAPGNPLRFRNDSDQFHACGWIFHLDEVFNRRNLINVLREFPAVIRLKGVFRGESDWWSINRAKEEITYSESTWRRDSRLELIVDSRETFDINEFERLLFDCRVD